MSENDSKIPQQAKNNNPAEKSIGQLFLELRPGALWSILVSSVAITIAAFTLGTWIGPLDQKNKEDTSEVNETKNENNQQADIEASGALIVEFINNDYLMLGVIHVDKDKGMVFSPPAGKTENDEGPIETAIRETMEETGYTITDVNFLGNAPAGNENFSLVTARVDFNVDQKVYVHDGTAGIIWTNPTWLEDSDWRYLEQKKWIVDEFNKLKAERLKESE